MMLIYDKASTKIPKVQGLEGFWVGEHIHVSLEWHASAPLGPKLLLTGPFWTLFYYLFTWLFVSIISFVT